MISLGIDPGTHHIGFGVVEIKGASLVCKKYGVIENKGGDKMANFKKTAKSISKLITTYKPDLASIESLFFCKNQKTALAVSEMRGVIMYTISLKNVPLQEFTPLEVKNQICGYGKADKGQIQRIIRLILGIKEEIRPDDAADALAIAICGANNYTPYMSKFKED